jgi:hypothetical protein
MVAPVSDLYPKAAYKEITSCPERFDLGFLFYLIRWNSGPRLRLEQHLLGHKDKIIRLQKPAELQRWMDLLPNVA